jgi:hypothetical protein
MVRGFYSLEFNEIWVKAGLMFGQPDAELIQTVSHEARHCWQAEHWSAEQWRDHPTAENDAAQYARAVVHRIR